MPEDTAAAGEGSSAKAHEVLSLPDGSRRVRDAALNQAATSIEESLQVCLLPAAASAILHQ